MDRHWRPLARFTRGFSVITMLAFIPAVMPDRWIIDTAAWLGYPELPPHPLVFYLARQLSLLYGLLGTIGYWASHDLPARAGLVRLFAWLLLGLAAAQFLIDPWAGLPWWWTVCEAIGPAFGGAIIWWLHIRAAAADRSTTPNG
jgi:hypothetical protein